MKTIRTFLIFTLSLLVSASGLSAQNSTPKPIVFVVDASGSMWQKIGTEFKISIAREVLSDLVNGLPENQSFGLVAYGHRRKGDCTDIEMLLTTDNTDKQVFSKSLDALNPLGMTPLAKSAEMVIQDLRDGKKAASIILITDGMETCEGNLCELVASARQEGIDLTFHVVGFDMRESDRSPLECAAYASGGMYVDADDKEQLAEALKQTTTISMEDPDGRLSVKAIRDGGLIDATVLVFPKGAQHELLGKRTYSNTNTNPCLLHVPTGPYDLKVELVGKSGIQPQWLRDVRVTTEEQLLTVDFTSGKVSLQVTHQGELHDASVRIFDAGTERQVDAGRTYKDSRSNPIQMELSPGSYYAIAKSVSIKGDGNEHRLDFSLRAGEQIDLKHEFQSAELRLGVKYQGALADAAINILSAETGKSVSGGRTYSGANSNPKSFVLSPGTYRVTVKGVRVAGDPSEEFTIELKPGAIVEKSISW
jgi:Ca-activated chloride channel family protein